MYYRIIIKWLCCFFLFQLGNLNLAAQWENIIYDDTVYQENIHSVQFHIDSFPLTQPVLNLNLEPIVYSDSVEIQLLLTFDDLGTDLKSYYYTILHCDADWTPSDLNTLEYLNGFNEEEIRDPNFSFNTLTPYTNYQLRIPNEKTSWKKSGNYILLVYDEDENPILTRRFLCVEPLVKFDPTLVRPANMQKFRTHQEIDFRVSFEQLSVKEPKTEIKATILQNGRWDNAIQGIAPYFLYNGSVVFDYQDLICFSAGKEYRFIDLRSFEYRAEGIAAIEEYEDVYEITLHPDGIRSFEPYVFIRDVNGNFTIENLHRNNNYLESDYAMTLFTLKKSVEYQEADVYLFGKLTDWKIQNRYKMTYNDEIGAYLLDILLKQGFYNYSFAVVKDENPIPDVSHTEGNSFETENMYTLLVYFRPFGGRYDRLVGTLIFDSYLRRGK